MNMNFLRTLLTWGAIIATGAVTLFGCVTDALGVVDCSASWLPPQYAGYFTMGVLILNQLMKAFQGGLPLQGLFSPTVVVSTSGAVGTVTPRQVATDGT